MSKRAFRREVEPQPEAVRYPTLDSARTDRRRFLRHLGLGIVGASALGGLAACGDRALGHDDPEPDLGPPTFDTGGAADLAPPPGRDRGTPDVGGAAPMPDVGLPEPDSWETAGGPELPPDAGAGPDDALPGG